MVSVLAPVLQHRAGLQSAGDYTLYRKYATNRIHKLRKRAGLTAKPSKQLKRQELASGQWELAVLDAERHWADAMSLSATMEANTTVKSSVKSQIASKLDKAVKYSKYATSLEAKSDLPSTTKLEFAVYAALVAGEAGVERQHWEKVAKHFAKVRIGVPALISAQPEQSEALETLLATSVDPAFRLALSQQKEDSTVDLSARAAEIVSSDGEFVALVKSVDPKALEQGSAEEKVTKIQFRSHTAEVKYRSLAQLLAEAQKASANTAGSSASAYETAIELWQQCEFEVSSLISEINSAGEQREQDLDIINTYVQFEVLRFRILRDSSEAHAIFSQRASAGNSVRLYAVVLQSCAALGELPGVFNDDELMEGIDLMSLYFKTFRTLALAKTHALGSKEALALVKLAYDRFEAGVSKHSGNDLNALNLPIKQADVSSLQTEVQKELVRAHSFVVLYSELENRSNIMGSATSNVEFRQVPTKGEKHVRVADLEAAHLEPVMVKPVFYDMAFNYVHPEGAGDEQEEEMQVEQEQQETPKKKGLFGLF